MRILMLYGFAPHTTANYLARAYKADGHDVRTAGRVADLTGWAEPYRLWGPHNYVLEEGQALRLGGWKPDLVLWVESGLVDLAPLEHIKAPTAAWFIDSQNPDKLRAHLQVAPLFDHVFVAHKGVLSAFDDSAHWLPLACDPEIHTPRPGIEPTCDLAYVGNAYGDGLYTKRMNAMRDLAQRYSTRFGSNVYFQDMADVYAGARIGWNMSLTGGDIVMRVFEVMCSGRPLVTDLAPESGLLGLFCEDTELLAYGGDDEMLASINLLLAEPGYANEVGAAGRAAVLAAHTYAHRAREILAVCGG